MKFNPWVLFQQKKGSIRSLEGRDSIGTAAGWGRWRRHVEKLGKVRAECKEFWMLITLSFLSYLTMRFENTTFVFIYSCQKCWFLIHPQPLPSPEPVHRCRTSWRKGRPDPLKKGLCYLAEILCSGFSFLSELPASGPKIQDWQFFGKHCGDGGLAILEVFLGGQYSALQDAGHPGGCTAVMLLRLTPRPPVTATFSWPHQGLWVSTVHSLSPSYQFSWEHWCYSIQWYKKREASN